MTMACFLLLCFLLHLCCRRYCGFLLSSFDVEINLRALPVFYEWRRECPSYGRFEAFNENKTLANIGF